MTFLFCKWLIAANIVTRRGRVSDSEEEAAPQQATEATHEAMVSTRGKEAAESSRKGKEPVLPAGSEEEFDSEETETSEEAGSREEGELPADAASPGDMETEETSFVQQMQDALKEGPAGVPPTPDIDPSATDTVKLKEAGTSSGALESVPVNEDAIMKESVGGEATHATEVEEFNEHHLDFDLSEGDHQYISDLLSGKTPGAATESNVGVGSTEAGPSGRPAAGADTTIITGTSDRPEGSELVPWAGTENILPRSLST
ncbi:uncharacterized protein LOC109846778 [Asparagus officinalis]|uniref:uncharacterized protein LOC109846778 n=1 Tax=Asparagus officinalis TaxID=4686 RepID=UPI00098DFFFF|nr:uncharacterized protein LOC109846778 [Asparagus officinalis]